MKPKTLILMVVAVTCGLGASYMTSRLLANRAQPEAEEKINILVAAKDLPQGKLIKNPEEDFVAKAFLRGTEPKDHIARIEDIKGKVLKRSLKEGHAVTTDELLNEKDSGIAAMMAQGYRAVGVRVNMESTAGGFASLPLSRVDVISTVRRGDDKQSFSQVLLEDVLVLAVDTNMYRDAEGRAMPGSVVTLALKPEEALKVSIARELGPLSMVLRKFGDRAKTDADKVTVEQLMTRTEPKTDVEEDWTKVTGQPPVAKTELPPAPKQEPKAADVVVTEEPRYKKHVLRIVEGDNVRSQEYRLDEKGEVISRDASAGDASATPPRPAPVVAPPAVQETPAVPPAVPAATPSADEKR